MGNVTKQFPWFPHLGLPWKQLGNDILLEFRNDVRRFLVLGLPIDGCGKCGMCDMVQSAVACTLDKGEGTEFLVMIHEKFFNLQIKKRSTEVLP